MRNSAITILLTLAGPAAATTIIQPCGSVVDADPAGYCHERLAHRPDMMRATPEAREYARQKCLLEQRLRSGR